MSNPNIYDELEVYLEESRDRVFSELDMISEHFGDQQVLEIIKNWLDTRMGGNWRIEK